MSKSPLTVRPFLKILVGVLVIIGLLMGLLTIHQKQIKMRIDHKYRALQLPRQLSLQSVSWTGGSIDTSSAWTYNYTAKGQRQDVFNELETDLKKSGYSIDFASKVTEDYITARDVNNKLYLTIYLLPNDNNGITQVLDSVSISAEESPIPK